MKKHPVDDLFKSKLSTLEKKPSAAAWQRIQDRQTKNIRPLGWVWYVAAGVALALLTGYVVWINQETYFEPEIAEVQNGKKIAAPLADPDTVADENKEKQLALSGTESVKTTVSESVAIATRMPKATRRPKSMESDKANEDRQPVTGEDLVEAKAEQNEPVRTMVPQIAEMAVEEKLEESLQPKAENRTILVKVELPDDQNSERPRASRFTKIFRQLKNVKDGESVNWTDVGFNPKSVVARVDNRLRQGEEKVSEKYQDIKERTKL